MRAPLPSSTRRAIDRLARRAHAFHRFAHHPLCDLYASELIPLGRKARVCKGCAFVGLGALAGALAALTVTPSIAVLGASAISGVALFVTSFAHRSPKWLGRGLAAASSSFAGLGGLISGARFGLAIALGLCACATFIFWGYRRRGPHRGPCEHCPELRHPAVCSGLRPIVRRERAFRRVAQRALDRALFGR
ncbi:MAG TPA: hypothetical protein VGM44_10755 [Polyangiaceae bacterium]|jgi:hypothetical protein